MPEIYSNKLGRTVTFQIDAEKNIQMLVTEAEKDMLRRDGELPIDSEMSWSNSCNTYIFQQHIAGARHEIQEELKKLNNHPSLLDKTRSALGYSIAAQIQTLKKSDQLMQDMHALSSCFIEFEGLLNNPPHPADPEASLTEIKTKIAEFAKNIQAKIAAITVGNEGEPNFERMQNLRAQLNDKMTARVQEMNARLDAIKPPPTTQDITRLLRLQNYDGDQKPLGLLASDCLLDIRDAGMKMGYTIGGRIGENFEQGPALSALSNIGADISKKMGSVYGAQFNSNHPTSPAHLSLLTRPASETPTGSEKKYLNISHYLGAGKHNDEKAVAALLESVTGTPMALPDPDSDETQANTRPLTRLLVGTVIDFPLAIVFTPIDLIASLATRAIAGPENANTVHEAITSAWRSISPLSWMKGENKTTAQTTAGYESISDKLTESVNYETGSAEHFIPLNVIKAFTVPSRNQFIAAIDQTTKFFIGDPKAPSSTFRERLSYAANAAKSIYPATINYYRSREPLITVFSDLNYVRTHRKLYTLKIGPLKIPYAIGINSASQEKDTLTAYDKMVERNKPLVINTKMQKELAELNAESHAATHFDDPKYVTAMKQAATITSLIQDVSAVFGDVVIDANARHSPIPATAYFLLASGSLGGFMAPSLMAPAMHVAGPLLQAMPNALAHVFTGQQATSIFPQTAGCLLQFKTLFFGTELLKKAANGTLDTSMLNNPEILIAGGIALVAAGLLESLIPHIPTTIAFGGNNIPNPYADLINFFSTEAKHLVTGYSDPLMDATLPARALEAGFLGFKLGTLTYDAFKIPGPTQYNYDKNEAVAYTKEQTAIIDFISKFTRKIADKTITQVNFETEFNQALDSNEALTPEAKAKLQTIFHKDVLTNPEKIKRTQAIVQKAQDAMKALSSEQSPQTNAENSSFAETKSLSPLETAHQNLRAVLLEKQNVDLVGSKYFTSRSEAMQFYDQLHNAYETYNSELRKTGLFHKEIDPKPNLEEFYNNHCHKEPIGGIRAVSIIPFYPVTLVVRAIGYATAKPSRREEIRKYTANDLMIPIQLFGATNRVLRPLARLVGWASRPVVTFASKFVSVIFIKPLVRAGNYLVSLLPEQLSNKLKRHTDPMNKAIVSASNTISETPLHKTFDVGPFKWMGDKVRSVVNRVARVAQSAPEAPKPKETKITENALKQLGEKAPKPIDQQDTKHQNSAKFLQSTSTSDTIKKLAHLDEQVATAKAAIDEQQSPIERLKAELAHNNAQIEQHTFLETHFTEAAKTTTAPTGTFSRAADYLSGTAQQRELYQHAAKFFKPKESKEALIEHKKELETKLAETPAPEISLQ